MVTHFKLVAILAIAMLTFTSPVLAAPKGAVKLSNDKVFERNGYYCGKPRSVWIAGRMLARGFFYSHAAERKNVVALAKVATGKKKKNLTNKAKNLKELTAARNPECADGSSVIPTPTPEIRSLKFNLSSAVGLALRSATSSLGVARVSARDSEVGSNMSVVTNDGQLEESVSSGSAVISNFLIAPNDKIYVIFSQRTNLEDTQQEDPNGCLLAEIDRETGIPTCIDNEISQIVWLNNQSNKSIQFDNTGAIYYLAIKNGGTLTLRKFSNGGITDLINDNIAIDDFLVLPDGSIILSGTTGSPYQRWIRKILVSGGLQTVKNVTSCNTQMNFMRIFPDDKIYFGIDDCSPGGIYRMDQNASSLEAAPWMGVSKTWVDGIEVDLPEPIAFDCYPPYTDTLLGHQLSQGCGAYTQQSYRTPDGKMFFIANNKLFKYYPTVAKPVTIVTKINVAQGMTGSIILAGFNNSDRNVLSQFNTVDDSEVELIGPDNEIEIYHLNYIETENKIMFDGLRFSDNKYVIGKVDLNTLQVTASYAGGSTRLEDFQTF